MQNIHNHTPMKYLWFHPNEILNSNFMGQVGQAHFEIRTSGIRGCMQRLYGWSNNVCNMVIYCLSFEWILHFIQNDRVFWVFFLLSLFLFPFPLFLVSCFFQVSCPFCPFSLFPSHKTQIIASLSFSLIN